MSTSRRGARNVGEGVSCANDIYTITGPAEASTSAMHGPACTLGGWVAPTAGGARRPGWRRRASDPVGPPIGVDLAASSLWAEELTILVFNPFPIVGIVRRGLLAGDVGPGRGI